MSRNADDHWMNSKWRPMMGWMYMSVCIFDMILFPILWSLIQAVSHQQLVQWNPLTLQGAGLFHIAMGAVLGIAAFGRTQEKIAGNAANQNSSSTNTFGEVVNSAYQAATPVCPLPPNDPQIRNTRSDI